MAIKPLYRRVEDYLRQGIDNGELMPGDLIESEPQLAKVLDVSQGTVKKAIENLVNEKILYRHQGKGTYVSRIDFNNSLFRYFSYGTHSGGDIRIRKETPIRCIQQGEREICNHLGLAPASDLVYLERVGFVEELPILVENSWWNANLLHGLEDQSAHIPDLLYAVVQERFGISIVRAEETLTAEAADKSTANRLGIVEGDPLVVLMRLAYTKNNQPVEFRITRGRADKFSYKTEIR